MKFLKTWLLAWALYNVFFDLVVIGLFLIVCFISWQIFPIDWELVWTVGRITLVASCLAGLSYCFSADGKKEWR